jgi:glycosyltransferase involved in cell wall biosynthesis
MADAPCDLLFLGDRLLGREWTLTLRALFRGLERLGHTCRVLCCSAESDHGLPNLAECPGLARRWQRPWAIRGLELGDGSARPRLMHILTASMAEPGLEIAERWRLPYLLSVDEFPRRDARIRLSRSWCRGLIATNHELAIALNRDFDIPWPSIHRVPQGIPDPEPVARTTRTSRVPVIGAAGPLVSGSGFSTFLNAARKVVDAGVDAEFLIAGEGEDEGDLRRRAQRLRIADRLTFADEIPAGLTFWDVLDIYCQTSVSPTVGRPLTLAMASGVPSIVSNVEGLRTLVKDGETGLSVSHGDSNALARSIVELLADPARSRLLGESGRQAILRDCHPDRETERLGDLYRVIAKAGLGPLDSGLAARVGDYDAPSGLDIARAGGASGIAVAPWFGSEG